MAENSREVYGSGKIKIGINARDFETHYLWIGNDYVIIRRGLLEEAASSEPERVKQIFSVYSEGKVDKLLRDNEISYEQFTRTLAQARIRELEVRLLSISRVEKRSKEPSPIQLEVEGLAIP